METIDITKPMQSFINHINSKRKLSFLFGAGISIKFVPAIEKITKNIEIVINQTGEPKKIGAWESLKAEASSRGKKFNIEYVFSALSNKLIAIGGEILLGMNAIELAEYKSFLVETFNNEIIKNIRPDSSGLYDSIIDSSPHKRFAEWIGHRNLQRGIEVFTPNYDCLIELSFESMKVRYFDGFSGGFIPFFDSSAIDDSNYRSSDVKLWKIHGSLGWCEKNGNIIKSNADQNRILILPSSMKYDETKKLPYAVLLDRLSSALKEKESTLITCGYSFNDNHINDIIFNSLKSNSSAQVFAFIYDKALIASGQTCNISELGNCQYNFLAVNGSTYEELSKKSNQIVFFGFRTVINRGLVGLVKTPSYPEKPNDDLLYFSYDTVEDPVTHEETCNGYGELKICDFEEMTKFLLKIAGDINEQ